MSYNSVYRKTATGWRTGGGNKLHVKDDPRTWGTGKSSVKSKKRGDERSSGSVVKKTRDKRTPIKIRKLRKGGRSGARGSGVLIGDELEYYGDDAIVTDPGDPNYDSEDENAGNFVFVSHGEAIRAESSHLTSKPSTVRFMIIAYKSSLLTQYLAPPPPCMLASA